jgi:hypothetical protein
LYWNAIEILSNVIIRRERLSKFFVLSVFGTYFNLIIFFVLRLFVQILFLLTVLLLGALEQRLLLELLVLLVLLMSLPLAQQKLPLTHCG